jgi:hypothetical protein
VKTAEDVVLDVADVMADSRELTSMARPRDWKRPPVYAVASFVLGRC